MVFYFKNTQTDNNLKNTPKKFCQQKSSNPFGIFAPYNEAIVVDKVNITRQKLNEYLNDLGVNWIQEMPIENSIESAPQNINVYSRIVYYLGQVRAPYNSESYKSEVRQTIKKYKDRVKYWEADTEPGGLAPPDGWLGQEEQYVEFLKIVHGIMKEECPDCKLILGEMSGSGVMPISEDDQHDPAPKFLKHILSLGAKGYFEGFGFKMHFARAQDYILIKNKMDVWEKILGEYGIDIKQMPIFVETAMYDGQPVLPAGAPFQEFLTKQTEADQASSLVKTYVFGATQGIKVILWNDIIERKDFDIRPTGVYSHYGLIKGEQYNFAKKLDYFSYKKLIEVLGSSDWNDIKTISNSNGIYIYKFNRCDQPVWVAWNENSNQEATKINIGDIKKVIITKSVPGYEKGADVSNYESAFENYGKTANNGELDVALGNVPIYIEPYN